MEAEKFFSFYDSYWFELQVLNKQRFPSSYSKFCSVSETQNPKTETESSQIQIQTRHTRSTSEQFNSAASFASGFSSTDSSSPPKLFTILSGKDIPALETTTTTPEKQSLHTTEPPKQRKRMRRKRSETKSLSDLEFEELKGFMDLGFVFSEEDRASSLAEIIPGLHRLGKSSNTEEEQRDEEEKGWDFDCEDKKEETLIPRPYLSEAWEFLNLKPKREYQNPLMNLRFPALSNEIDMKDHLKLWAHTVASTVR